MGGAAPPSQHWGRLAPGISPARAARTPARPRAWRFPTPRHFPVRREMPSTFPLSLQLLDCQMSLCASLGVFSTAPFLSRRAGLTSPTAFSGLAGWGDGSIRFRVPLPPRPTRLGDISLSRKADALDKPLEYDSFVARWDCSPR